VGRSFLRPVARISETLGTVDSPEDGQSRLMNSGHWPRLTLVPIFTLLSVVLVSELLSDIFSMGRLIHLSS
jgi:hypothetical protein